MTIDKLGLSKKALQIATDRPPLWEYRLFAQVIIDEVETVKNIFQQGHRAQDVIAGKVDTPLNLQEWMRKKFDEFQIITAQLHTLIDSNHDDAFGPPGMPGDVIGIVEYSRKIVTVYFHAVAWSQTVRNTPIDSQYAEIRHEFSSLTTGITTGIEQFGHEILQQIDNAINDPPSGIPRTITIELKVEVPTGFAMAVERWIKGTGDSFNENSRSAEISKQDANDFRRKHVVLENISYWDADNKKFCPAKLEVIGYSFDMTVIGSKQRRTWEFSPDWGELTVSEDKFMEKILLNLIDSKGTEDKEYFTVTLNHDIIFKMSSRNFDLLKQHYQEMNEHIPALKESFSDKVNSIVLHLLKDSELVEMGKNFIDDMPIVFYTDTKYLMLIECLFGDAYTSIGRSLLLSSKEERDLYIKENSEFVESNRESATSYLNDRLTMFAQVLKERVPEANIYTAYIFVYNVVIRHLAQKWETDCKPFFLDIGELDLDTAIERYCAIDTIAHKNIISAGTFVYYLIQQGKFERGNRNYFDCMNIFVPKLNKIIDGRKYKNFVDRLKTPKSEKKYTIDDVDLMSGQEFEKFIAELFSRMGYEMEVTKATGDQGVDVIASKRGNKIGIQAKCYSGTVGNSAIQEVVAGKNYYHLDKAMVISNNLFTDAAQQLAHANSIVLWDRNILKEKIDEIFNARSD